MKLWNDIGLRGDGFTNSQTLATMPQVQQRQVDEQRN